MNDWLFADAKNVATMTVRRIMDGTQPILFVSHDADDGMWQFLTGASVDMAQAMVVGLEEIYRLDSTIGELADLPLGWIAERTSPVQPWRRQPR
jgi:hypothetical protein